jgi:lactoylglutathione lyase
VTWFSVPADRFAVTRGSLARYRASARATRGFCGSCGTQLTYQLDEAQHEIDVTACSLDDPEQIRPEDHTYLRSRLSWVKLADGLPGHATTRAQSLESGPAAALAHVALWSEDLERLRAFYEGYFGARAGPRYENPRKGFESYFLTLAGGARIELMHSSGAARPDSETPRGYAHIALALGSQGAVDSLTERLRADGYAVIDGPRRTGDGYYESVILDPDGNRVELTA